MIAQAVGLKKRCRLTLRAHHVSRALRRVVVVLIPACSQNIVEAVGFGADAMGLELVLERQ
jgi:hypothetical protein